MNTQATYQPMTQDPHKDEREEKDDKCCYHCFCWFFQISVWILLVTSIVLIFLKNEIYSKFLIAFGVADFIYLILELCSPTGKYLCNKSSDEGMYQKLLVYFRTPPRISFHCECYHYETTTHTRTDSEGNTETYTTTEKVTTHTETYHMPYYSVRDVSGLFYLNCDMAEALKKTYIKLKLGEEINFADAISYMDYKIERENFDARNRDRDEFYDSHESRSIPGIIHHNLVKIGKKDPCSVNYFFFFLSTLLTFAEFYKAYVNSFCITQKYKIRKIISTRYDLNQPAFEEKYRAFNPSINLIIQTYTYENKDFNYLNDTYSVNLPTEEELEKAKEFQGQVPNYHISTGQGSFQAGVIIDNDIYNSDKANQVQSISNIPKDNIISTDSKDIHMIEISDKSGNETDVEQGNYPPYQGDQGNPQFTNQPQGYYPPQV